MKDQKSRLIFEESWKIKRFFDFYKDSSFIYNDVKEHSLTDPSLKPIVDFFEKYFDLEYANYIHNLTLKDIEKQASELANFLQVSLEGL